MVIVSPTPEGFDTADLIEAKRLLDELNDASGRN
jgi:hypothetical protein